MQETAFKSAASGDDKAQSYPSGVPTFTAINQMLDYAFEGMPKLVELQKKAIAQPFNRDRVRVVL